MTPIVTDAPESLIEHAAFVRAVARAVLGRDEGAVDDAVQETWVVALERGESRRGPLRPWLGGVARLTALALRRRRIRAERRDRASARMAAATSATSAMAVDDLAVRAEVGRRVVDAVLALEEPYRTAILLRYYDGAGPRHIAEILDVPLETVRTRLRRGLGRLRQALAERHEKRHGRNWRAALLPLVAGGRGRRPPGPSLWPWMAGGIAMKKLTTLVVVAVLVLGGLFVLRPWDATEDLRRRDAEDRSAAFRAEGTLTRDGEESLEAHLVGRPDPVAGPTSTNYPLPVDLAAVDRERDLHGLILREDGSPLPGARLQVLHHPWRDSGLTVEPALYYETYEGPETQSGRDGSFVVRLEPGRFAYLRVEAEGYAPLERARLSAGERIDITMRPAVTLRVRVRTYQGEGAGGVRLRLYPDRDSENTPPARWGTTDDAGEAVFEGLVPEESLRLLALPTAAGQGAAWTQTFALPVRGEGVQTIPLPSGWVLQGRVTEAATGRPIAGARVATFWQFVGAVETDAEGRFALPGVTAKWDETVHVIAAGYAREVVAVKGVRSLDVALHEAGRVVGRLVSASGAPVAGALLRTFGADAYQHAQDYSLSAGRSAADGTFRLGGLDRDRAHTLVVKAPGHAKTMIDFELTPGNVAHDLGDIRLAASGVVRGRVVDSGERPVGRVEVELKGWNEDRTERRGPDAAPVTLFYGTRETRNTDDLGRFAFVDVSPGAYTLKLAGGDQATAPVEVIVRADAPTEEVVLRKEAAREVLVTVRDEAGEAVPGATLRVREGRMVLPGGTTGEDGTTRLLLPLRALSLFVWVADDATWETVGPVEVLADASEVSVVLGRTRVFQATLVGPDGMPLPLAILRIEEGGTSHQRFTNGDGVFGLKVTSDELLSIYFYGAFQDAASYGRQYTLPLAAELHDVSPDDQDVVVRAQPVPVDRRASVRLLDPDGNPVAGVRVIPYPAMKGAPSLTQVTDAEGRAHFEGLPALPLMFYPSIQPTADRPWLRPVMERRMADEKELVLRMRRGARIDGRVIVPDGVPFEQVYVYARDPADDSYRANAKLDDEGRFVLIVDPNQGPSRLRIQHYDDRGEKTETVVEDVEAGRTGLDVTLRSEG